MRFWRQVMMEQMVDWSWEGAVEGHPFLEDGSHPVLPVRFACAECGLLVPPSTAEEMDKEVI
jgi:hypothetical protein